MQAPLDSGTYRFIVGDVHLIPETEIGSAIDAAERGDAESALRLWKYWGIAKHNRSKALYWLRKAATNGSPVGQYNLAVEITEDPSIGNADEARFWLQRSAAGAPSSMREELDELDRRIQSPSVRLRSLSDAASTAPATSTR